MSHETKDFYDFGNFRVDLTEKVLLRDGKSVPITPKVFETLQVMVENAGRLIEKDELMQKIWHERFVEESNLTFNIKMLRKALGDDAAKPRFIETVPKRGYRFIHEVRRVEAAEEVEEERFGETETDAVVSKISSSPFVHFSPSRLPPPSNLTPSISTIIGREKEIAEIRNLLSQNSVRILTMTGVGGTGKTTLAQAVAQKELANFKDGVFFVELAAVTNPELVASTIAQTLDVKETGDKPILEILENHLRGRKMLLVLDNFEQVLTAAPVLTKLAQAAPDLKILVTSRAHLHLSNDCEFVVPPLAVPESAARISLEELSEYESVKLFVERARAVKPNFALREENARNVAEICLRLDGLPLAIELAAERVRIIAPASILEKLENRLKLLTGGAKDLPDRQQTVRGMVEWSYELLETDEKTLFRRLAVFAGGFTFEAAETVCANYESNEDQYPKTNNQIEILDGITSLLDSSLLVQKEQADGESRFRMLEVVREYALEVLEASNESENMRRNHAGYFLALGEEAEPYLLGEQAIEWLEKIDRESDNLRAALRWAINSDAETAQRLTGALWAFWCIRGHLREGREQLEKSLAAVCDDERATTTRWKPLHGAGYIACQQGDYPAARKFFEQSLQIAEATGERRQIALSSRELGFVFNVQGDATQARRFYEKSLRLGKELSDEKVVALSLAALADLARAAGDYGAAQQIYEKTFRSFQAINNCNGMSATLCNLGGVAFALGDFAAARASYAQAVEAALKLKNKVYASWALDGFAALATRENDCELAARLAGSIENLRDSIGYELEAADRSFRDAYLTKTRHALGDARFARAYEAGRAIDLDEAVALAAPKVLTNGHHFKQNESENDGNQTQISEPINAYQAYQLARYHFQQMSPPDIIKSRALLEEAVRFDADFAPAHAALAEQSVFEVIVGFQTPAENFPKAKDALRRAFELNPHSAEFYAAAGYVSLVCDWNFAEAERNLRKALELNSHYVFANNYLGHVFMFQRLPEEAEFYLRRTVEIEPMSLYSRNILTIAYFLARNYQKVIEESEKTLAVYPRFFIAAQVRCWALEQTGRAAEAVAEYEKILREPSGEIALRWMGYACALVGDRENALETAAHLEAESREHYLSLTHLAQLYAGLNETDKAFFYLENALEQRDPWMLWIAADPRFDNLRLDSRFNELVRRVGLNGAQAAVDVKELRENLSSEEKSKRFASPTNENATAILQAATEDANKQSTEIQHSFSQTIKRHKPLAAFVVIALLVGSIGLGYYFFSAKKIVSGAVGKKSIAVLPFKLINSANRDEIYEIGITDSLILKLGSMKGFVVRPLSATRQYADIAQDALAAGREQQVDYVLASNYQLAGGKIRVTSQFFDVASGQIEETYKSEKDTGDFFAMQDAVADEIGRLLLARFATTSTGPAAKRGTTNEEAYRFYLQGMFLHDRGTARQKAVEALEQSVRLDPNYAQGWAGLAVTHRGIAYSANADIGEEYQKSIEAINKALSLDPNVSEAYTALCETKYQYEWDFAGAGRACQRALELNSNSSLAHNNYARFLLAYQQHHEEAIAEIKTAIDLDPTSFHNQRIYANTLYLSRRYDEAVAQYKRLMQMNEETDPTYQWLIRTLEMQGKEAEAFEWLMKSPSMQKKDDKTIQLFKTAYQTSGWAGVLRERDKTPGEGNFFRRAGWNARLGDKDKAFEYLEKAYQQRNPLLYLLQVEPTLDPLRDDPRFDELVRRVGLK